MGKRCGHNHLEIYIYIYVDVGKVKGFVFSLWHDESVLNLQVAVPKERKTEIFLLNH